MKKVVKVVIIASFAFLAVTVAVIAAAVLYNQKQNDEKSEEQEFLELEF